ncbi:hypothetical protein PSA5_26415 [Pseudomonas syringae pv. actinidiae]|nr:hypothetical protein PSA5_26415 [Pseudomonas syringae pv. actinidiae]
MLNLRSLGVAGQAQHQRVNGGLGGARTFVGRLPADGFADLIKVGDCFGKAWKADQREAAG